MQPFDLNFVALTSAVPNPIHVAPTKTETFFVRQTRLQFVCTVDHYEAVPV